MHYYYLLKLNYLTFAMTHAYAHACMRVDAGRIHKFPYHILVISAVIEVLQCRGMKMSDRYRIVIISTVILELA